jgi:hypothetical protein
MASARFEELYFIAIFSQRAHEDATRRANRQDIVSYTVGNIHQRQAVEKLTMFLELESAAAIQLVRLPWRQG